MWASIIMMYDICRVLCLENPQNYYGVLPSTRIVFATVNITVKQAKDVLYEQLISWIMESSFFRSFLNKNKNKKATDALFINRIDIMLASRAEQTTGRAILGAILDEANFQSVVKDQAARNYGSILRRVESRFLGKGGSLPGHMILSSSKSDESGWLQGHIVEVKENPHVLIKECPIWEAKKDEGIYSGQTFQVFIGDDTRDPFVVKDQDNIKDVDPQSIIKVPIEYYGSFDGDIFKSLQEIAGCGTFAAKKFIPSVELIKECQIRPNPVTKEVIELSFSDQSDQLINYILFDKLSKDRRPRFIHIDLGITNDRTGIASLYHAGTVSIRRFDPDTLTYMMVREPIFFIDFILYVKGKGGDAVAIGKIKSLLQHLRTKNYPIGGVSMDGFQSVYFLQELMTIGFETEKVSTDLTKEPYAYLKNAILESRLNGVEHPILHHELSNLIDVGKKIDHPSPDDKYSKDGSDAIAGAMWHLFTSMNEHHGITWCPNDYLDALEEHVHRDTKEQSDLAKMFRDGEKHHIYNNDIPF